MRHCNQGWFREQSRFIRQQLLTEVLATSGAELGCSVPTEDGCTRGCFLLFR